MSEVTYEAPGPGTWELETTHFQKPVSAYTQELLGAQLARGGRSDKVRRRIARLGRAWSHTVTATLMAS